MSDASLETNIQVIHTYLEKKTVVNIHSSIQLVKFLQGFSLSDALDVCERPITCDNRSSGSNQMGRTEGQWSSFCIFKNGLTLRARPLGVLLVLLMDSLGLDNLLMFVALLDQF